MCGERNCQAALHRRDPCPVRPLFVSRLPSGGYTLEELRRQFRLGPNYGRCFTGRHHFERSPKIPVVIAGIRVPIIMDTGAEVSILNTILVQNLFPGKDLSTNSREVHNFGGGLVTIKGPIELNVEICNLLLKHECRAPLYFYDGNPTFLMGFDLITRAALMIDAKSRSVWSKHTLRCHISQNLANSSAKPTIQVNANTFLETAPPCVCPHLIWKTITLLRRQNIGFTMRY